MKLHPSFSILSWLRLALLANFLIMALSSCQDADPSVAVVAPTKDSSELKQMATDGNVPFAADSLFYAHSLFMPKDSFNVVAPQRPADQTKMTLQIFFNNNEICLLAWGAKSNDDYDTLKVRTVHLKVKRSLKLSPSHLIMGNMKIGKQKMERIKREIDAYDGILFVPIIIDGRLVYKYSLVKGSQKEITVEKAMGRANPSPPATIKNRD